MSSPVLWAAGLSLAGLAALSGLTTGACLTAAAAHDARSRAGGVYGLAQRRAAISAEATVLTEPVVVTTVVGNLVDNGIDAASGPDGGQPGEVEVEVIADGDTVLVTVGDSGPGIAFEDPDDVFAEGATTKSGAHVPGGRGMGLALARQIARRVGGDVWVADAGGRGSADDDEPGGAVFVARLPGVLAPTDEAEDDSYSQTEEPGVTP